ncbi:hypothetical protein [Caulobacter sp. Root343]|uniref:hypothetical protein n=1 Tax=Caulobacter sp. Root343 TaxID=1736520 RepID=UPI0006FA44F8|nr:hypothetical protein [Caulobacter sp. Root343]KQV66617.1 hypothetical protein ASC70_12345 [Caulobacter sp. Root343]
MTETTKKISWLIPTEAARALAMSPGIEAIVALELRRRATFRPHAELSLNETGFSADLQYDDPAYPGQVLHLAVQLSAVPKENAFMQPRMEGVRT